MRQSILFTKTLKETPKDEVALNAQLLERGGFIFKNSAGIYSYLPLGWLAMQKIASIIREEMNFIGGQELLMPALHDKRYLKATGRWDIGVVFKVSEGDGKEPQFNISWTHEEIMSEIASRYVNSYKDLPFSTYQIQTKFRNEPRAKSGLLRGREFMMKDLYSFHRDEEDLNRYYDVVKEAYFKIFNRCGLKAYYTLAAGGEFTKDFTHEFQVLADVGEDTILVCIQCGYAENKEISKVKNGDVCPKCGDHIQEKKSIEVGNIFRYGTKYSEPFNLRFIDEMGASHFVVTGAYGIGLGRVLATIVELYNDEKGICWPKTVSPFDVHLVSLEAQNNEVKLEAEKLYDSCKKAKIEVLYDDREDVSSGFKLRDSDLIGIPLRVVISPKTLEKQSVEVKKRTSKDLEFISIKTIVSYLQKHANS